VGLTSDGGSIKGGSGNCPNQQDLLMFIKQTGLTDAQEVGICMHRVCMLFCMFCTRYFTAVDIFVIVCGCLISR